MQPIDLHTHSTASDGTNTPLELIYLAKKSDLSALALTDHDTIDGLDEAILAGKKWGIEVIPGIELAADYAEQNLHILGYFIDHHSTSFLNALDFIKTARINRNQQMLVKLQDQGFNITQEDVAKTAGEDIITRAHFARALYERGYTKSIKSGIEEYLVPGKSAYVKRKVFSPKQCIDMIHKAGGVAVLAHPTLYNLDDIELRTLLSVLSSYNLDGIEAIYTLYSSQEEQYFRGLADEYNLCITGGSDYHGANKPDIHLGSGYGNLNIPYSLLAQLKKRRPI